MPSQTKTNPTGSETAIAGNFYTWDTEAAVNKADNIYAETNPFASRSINVFDYEVFLFANGVKKGVDRSQVGAWSTTEGIDTYGGPTDL